MRILIITYFFPPDRAVGGQRAMKVVDALREAGHDVEVIAAGNDGGNDSDHIRRVRPLPSIRDLFGMIRRAGRTAAAPGANGSENTVVGPVHANRAKDSVARWKRWIFSAIWLPDDRQGFIWPAVRTAVALPGGRPDLVYTTAPPFSVHLAGLLTKALTGTPWIAEFRDPWTTNPWKPAFVRSSLSDWAERRLERLCLGQADLVVAVSDGITQDLAAAGANPRLLTVRNGIERLAAGEAKPARDPFCIVYVGSFYHTRDPFPFLEAVGRVVEDRRLRPERLTVRLIGTTDVFGGRSIPAFIAERGLDRFVRLEGWMEREACLAEVATADALLLLAMEQPTQVPNKVYEYLGTRRPILAIADAGGETARMLHRSGGHEVVTANDPDLIEDAVRRLIDRDDRGPVGDEVRLVEWTTRNQMAKLVEAIGGVDVG